MLCKATERWTQSESCLYNNCSKIENACWVKCTRAGDNSFVCAERLEKFFELNVQAFTKQQMILDFRYVWSYYSQFCPSNYPKSSLFRICASVPCTLEGTKIVSFPTVFFRLYYFQPHCNQMRKPKPKGNWNRIFCRNFNCDSSFLLTGLSLTWLQTLRQVEIHFVDLGVCLSL